ncbi:TonB-dependent copper receptor [Acinetobacter rudis]|uniref:TonB-dependent copper receptor n=1 Tax=Acinetobacter rudis CIP 110305 TaxID=421052 RepID=S3PSF0_9GAMM|nr:TonB-dependent copper receptor [Acinetobacter rudis]EPF81666.1 TonB-dependent copper receptor [Acinetobacter rudis CIP 110305]
MAQPKFYLQPLAAAICVAYSSTAIAQQHQAHNERVTLAPIVLTAQKANDANGLIVHADPKQAIQPIPAVDGSSYLQSIPGFNQVKGGGANGDVTFRGMFGSRIKIVTDGNESLGACPSRMDTQASYISPESYDSITVVKGPQTVQYAHTGSAATVSFDRGPEQLTTEKPYRGQASVLWGSYGRFDQNIETAIGDEKKYARLNANRSVANDYKDGNGDKVHSNWEKWSADLALGWTPDEDTWLELKGGKADAEVAYAGRGMDGSQFKRDSLGLKFEKKNLNDVIKQVDAQVDYSYNDHIMDNFSLRTPPMMTMGPGSMSHMMPNPMEMQVTRRSLNARATMTTEWDKLSLITGVDSQLNKHGKNMIMFAMPSMNTPSYMDMKFQSYGAFGELTYQFNDANKLVTGARIDHSKIEQYGKQSNLIDTRKETLPSAFVRLENTASEHGLKSYVGVGYVERVPDYWELFSTTYAFSGNTLNNLKNEKTLQMDLGTQFEHGAFSSWASAYVGLVNDYILMRYVPIPDPKDSSKTVIQTQSRNVDATIAGAEAGMGYQFTDQIQADVSAMYAWGKNTTDSTALPQIAPLEGRFNLRYVEDKYNVGLLWRVVAKQDRISKNEGTIIGYDFGESKAFNTLSLNATYNLTKDVDLSVGVDNLLDKNYTEHLNKQGNSGFDYAAFEQFNNIGRNYWARMSMKF